MIEALMICCTLFIITALIIYFKPFNYTVNTYYPSKGVSGSEVPQNESESIEKIMTAPSPTVKLNDVHILFIYNYLGSVYTGTLPEIQTCTINDNMELAITIIVDDKTETYLAQEFMEQVISPFIEGDSELSARIENFVSTGYGKYYDQKLIATIYWDFFTEAYESQNNSNDDC